MRIARKSLISTALGHLTRMGVTRIAWRARRGKERSRFFVLPDDYIGSTVIAEGDFEIGYLAAVEEILRLARGKGLLDARRPVAVDVGANIGTHTVFLARHFPRVHSFEPLAMLHHVLSANIDLNKCTGVTAHQVALSDRDETLPYLERDPGNLGSNGFERVGGTATASWMPLVRGDQFLLSKLEPDEQVVLMKVDVEGLEDKVIDGLSGLLERDHPLVLCELAGSESGRKVCDSLRAAGYGHIYDIHNRSRYGGRGLPRGIAVAICQGVEYRLVPLEHIENRVYPMILASPVSLLA